MNQSHSLDLDIDTDACLLSICLLVHSINKASSASLTLRSRKGKPLSLETVRQGFVYACCVSYVCKRVCAHMSFTRSVSRACFLACQIVAAAFEARLVIMCTHTSVHNGKVLTALNFHQPKLHGQGLIRVGQSFGRSVGRLKTAAQTNVCCRRFGHQHHNTFILRIRQPRPPKQYHDRNNNEEKEIRRERTRNFSRSFQCPYSSVGMYECLRCLSIAHGKSGQTVKSSCAPIQLDEMNGVYYLSFWHALLCAILFKCLHVIGINPGHKRVRSCMQA